MAAEPSGAEGAAWTADRFGEPSEVLAYGPRSWDAPPEGAVLVEVAATGVGLPDLFMVRGIYPMVPRPPVTPGQEVCGTVVSAPASSRFSVGDRVFGPTRFYAGSGGYATHALLGEGTTFHAPAALSDEAAAGFYVGFRTAYTALVTRAAVEPGETVLVLGGSGSTGATAISLAKALDARVVAVASTDAKRQFCLDLGADVAIDRDTDAIRDAAAEHSGGAGFNVVIDPVGGDIANAALRSVARYGRFAVIGFASGSWPTIDPIELVMRNCSVVGVLAAGFSPEEDAKDMGELCRLAEEGRITVPVGQVASIDEVPQVLESMAGGGAPPGKLVVRVSPP